MSEIKVSIPNISCAHCVATIKREVGELQGVQLVEGDVKTKTVVVNFDSPASWNSIAQTLADIGFPPEK